MEKNKFPGKKKRILRGCFALNLLLLNDGDSISIYVGMSNGCIHATQIALKIKVKRA